MAVKGGTGGPSGTTGTGGTSGIGSGVVDLGDSLGGRAAGADVLIPLSPVVAGARALCFFDE